jgi:type III pantothenate kinase
VAEVSSLADELLTLDRGNTTLDCMLHTATGLVRQRMGPDDGDALREFLSGPVVRAIGLSVVDQGLSMAQLVLEELGIPLSVAGIDVPCPLDVGYSDPSTLGVDRWVGAVAAWREWGDAIIVDCGTAVTVNLVTREGGFVGGAIGPGPRTMAHGLDDCAGALPAVDLDAEPAVPTSSSLDAVNAGVSIGFCGLVERLVDDLIEATSSQQAALLITGGDAPTYLRHGRIPFQHVPDLVHRGLRCLDEPE